MFGAIATSMEASKDYIYPKVTSLKTAKSIYTVNLIFFNSAAATKVTPLLTVNVIKYGSQHTAQLGAMLEPALKMTPHPYKERAIQHRAHAVVVNYRRSSQHPGGFT